MASSSSSEALLRPGQSWIAEGFFDDSSRGSVSFRHFVSTSRKLRSVASSPRNSDCLSELDVDRGFIKPGFAIDFCCDGSNRSSSFCGGGIIRPSRVDDGSSSCDRSKDSRVRAGQDQLPGRWVAERSEESGLLRHKTSPAIEDHCRWGCGERPMRRRPKSGPTQPIQQVISNNNLISNNDDVISSV